MKKCPIELMLNYIIRMSELIGKHYLYKTLNSKLPIHKCTNYNNGNIDN